MRDRLDFTIRQVGLFVSRNRKRQVVGQSVLFSVECAQDASLGHSSVAAHDDASLTGFLMRQHDDHIVTVLLAA